MTDRVLLIEDDEAMRRSLTQTLELEDMVILQADGLSQARRSIRANFPGVILSDIRMPHDDGFDVLARVQDVDEDLPVVFLTGEADVPMAVRALQGGAYDFLEKPCGTEDLLKSLRRALRHRRLVLQARRLEQQIERSDVAAVNFPGQTPATTRLRSELRQASILPVPVHFFGEVGAGKRLAAHTLSVLSQDTTNVLGVNCNDPSIASSIEETSLSGIDTIILKNVETGCAEELEKLANKLSEAPGIRIISTATCRVPALPPAFASLVRETAVEIQVPSLKERAADLPIIFESLMRQIARDLNVDMPIAPQKMIDEVRRSDWSDNLPHLRAFARRCVLELQGVGLPSEKRSLSEQMDAFEREVLIEALRQNSGKAAAAAQDLSLARKTMYDRMARHGIKPRELKNL